MADVYSTRFVQAPSFSGGLHLEYTVPAGFRAVVRNISIVWGDVVASGLDAWVQDNAGAKLVRRTIAAGVVDYEDLGGCDVFEGRWVYEASEALYVQTATGTCDFLASGFLLALP